MNNSKKVYMTPTLEVMNARVEKGFAGSGNYTMYLGSNEAVEYNGEITYGGGAGGSDGNMEGVGYGGTIFFFKGNNFGQLKPTLLL